MQIVPAKFYGMWFLKHTASDNWDVLPVTRDGFIFSLFGQAVQILTPAYQYVPSALPIDALVHEIGAAFEAEPKSAEDMLLPPSLTGPAVDSVLNHWANSSSIALRASALAGMLSRNQEGSLDELEEFWPAIKDDPSREVVIAELRNSFRDSKPESILKLIGIANATPSSSELRAAAVRAITANAYKGISQFCRESTREF